MPVQDTPSHLLKKGEALIARLEALLTRVESVFPDVDAERPDREGDNRVFRWVKEGSRGTLKPVPFEAAVLLQDLRGIDRQKETLLRNTRQFLLGYEANNVLLWGARGTGKSSLIRALVTAFADRKLHLVEVRKGHLKDLPDIVEAISAFSFRFILFCDDLSFEADEPGFGELKALLDGSMSTVSDRFLIYATSNRRHLITETLETTAARTADREIHPEEATDGQISLSDRFGLWLPFYPFPQALYLEIVFHWLETFNITITDRDTIGKKALQWALRRGSRGGRTAWQFAKDYAGCVKMKQMEERK